MDQVQEVSAKIVQLVSQTPTKTILGIHLGAALKAFFPDFHPFYYRSRNLRQFIRTYVPGVSEKGRSGLDVIYTVASAKNENTLPAPQSLAAPESSKAEFVGLPTTSYNWKAYSNPGYPFVIAVNRETGELQTFSQGSALAPPWAIVPKPSSEFHLGIANEFTSNLPEPLRTNLGALLHDPKWYVRFSAAAARNGMGPQWAAFRRTKLIENLRSSLRALAVPTTPDPARKFGAPVEVSPQKAMQPAVNPSDESSFRDLIRKVVSELPIGDLRSLKLPVGAVFDALRR